MADSRHITRRAALKGLPLAGVALALPAAADEPKFDLQDWLETAPVEVVVEYHLVQLAQALARKHGGQWQAINFPKHKVAMVNLFDANKSGVFYKPNGN